MILQTNCPMPEHWAGTLYLSNPRQDWVTWGQRKQLYVAGLMITYPGEDRPQWVATTTLPRRNEHTSDVSLWFCSVWHWLCQGHRHLAQESVFALDKDSGMYSSITHLKCFFFSNKFSYLSVYGQEQSHGLISFTYVKREECNKPTEKSSNMCSQPRSSLTKAWLSLVLWPLGQRFCNEHSTHVLVGVL